MDTELSFCYQWRFEAYVALGLDVAPYVLSDIFLFSVFLRTTICLFDGGSSLNGQTNKVREANKPFWYRIWHRQITWCWLVQLKIS